MTRRSIEKPLLRYGLVLGILYQLYQSIFDVLTAASSDAIFINLIVTMFFLLLLFLTRLEKSNNLVAVLLHVALLPAFVYFWFYNGGIIGIVPLIMCVYIGFIVATTNGLMKWLSVILYGAVLLVLIYFPVILGPPNQQHLNLSTKPIDYFVIALIITFFATYLKSEYLYYRNQVALRSNQLERIAATLTNQNEELRLQQEEIKSINENLESIIVDHTRGIEVKNKELTEYAFINAHMLRAPLSRILGLTNLMESESSLYSSKEIGEIKNQAQKIDQVIRKINEVLS